jgi:hypothetical protein
METNMRFFLPTLMLIALLSGKGHSQTVSCVTNADTTDEQVEFVTEIVTHGDSTSLVQGGIPYQPAEGVTLVADSTICNGIISWYNARDTATARHISRASVMLVGSSVYVIVGEKTPKVYIFVDSLYQWLRGYVAID